MNLMSSLGTPLSGKREPEKAGGKGGAGVGELGPKVPVSLDKELGLGGTSVGGEGRGEGLPLPVGEVLTARDKALKAMEVLRGVFSSGSGGLC